LKRGKRQPAQTDQHVIAILACLRSSPYPQLPISSQDQPAHRMSRVKTLSIFCPTSRRSAEWSSPNQAFRIASNMGRDGLCDTCPRRFRTLDMLAASSGISHAFATGSEAAERAGGEQRFEYQPL
jgi:hypothetical protein